MTKEEIENRIEVCQKKAMGYREAGKVGIADRYENEKNKWEKILSDLDLLNERKINELLDYKKGYYKQKEMIDKAIEYIENNTYFKDNLVKKMIFKDFSNKLLDILNEVSE